MDFLEIIGLSFLAIVLINLVSMIRAIKNARMNDPLSLESEQESS